MGRETDLTAHIAELRKRMAEDAAKLEGWSAFFQGFQQLERGAAIALLEAVQATLAAMPAGQIPSFAVGLAQKALETVKKRAQESPDAPTRIRG